MKKFFLLSLCSLPLLANNIFLNYQSLDFEKSKKKDKGKRYGFGLNIKEKLYNYQLLVEKTDTRTFKPPLNKDLEVDKYYIKVNKNLDKTSQLHFSYSFLQDNIMKETDGGKTYGIGYSYKMVTFTQYFTDYKHFDVFQSDIKYISKQKNYNFIMIGKYIKLKDKDSNKFSKNAKNDYFTLGLKLHTNYKKYHFGAGTFLGKRVFAVMKDGFKVQHHAMEFDKTLMCGVGKSYKWGSAKLRYIYQNATELPINNKNVKVKNISLELTKKF